MSGDFDASAAPLIAYVLELHARLEAGVRIPFDQEHARLKQRLVDDFRGDGVYRLARYALVCWIDELFLHSPWSKAWRRQTLEASLYGADEGATRFWDLARQATRTGPQEMRDLLRWLVLLGFRGALRDKEDQVHAWLLSMPQEEPARAEADPLEREFLGGMPNVQRLDGKRTLRRWLAAAGAGVALIAPAVGFFAVKHWLP